MISVVTLSHCPLMGKFDPEAAVVEDVLSHVKRAREFVASYAPDLVVLLAPDHYNGFFYRVMPSFCVGSHAEAIGDYTSATGELSVPTEKARALGAGLLERGIDIAVSEQMVVDHGFAQALTMLTGGLREIPVVPIFINCAAAPLGRWDRSRRLGSALGDYLRGLDGKILVIGSGGLSHDPPLPSLHSGDPAIVKRIVTGEGAAAARPMRESKAVEAARLFAAGKSPLHPLNPLWDQRLIALLATDRIAEVDTWDNAWVSAEGGSGAHEARTWVAAHAALGESKTFDWSYYRAVDEWLTGFGITVAHDRRVHGAA